MNKRQRIMSFLLLTCCTIFFARSLSNEKKNLYMKNENEIKNTILKTSDLKSPERIENTNLVEQKDVPQQVVQQNCCCEERVINASQKAILAVVNICVSQNKIVRRYNPMNDLFRDFFGRGFLDDGSTGEQKQEYKTVPITACGSGVIIKENGFIVTNNHVVEGAEKVEVTLHDNRKFEAKIIGTDAQNDISLLKIETDHLPFLELGDSDKLQIGETIISVGNPLGVKELSSTVTKGIVSAKMRILPDEQHSLSSLIQTDAAMNTGCSGGATVNMQGQLIGVNVAIAIKPQNQSFMGYSYAIPSNIVKRVVSDIEKYGYVQKIILGITVSDITDELVKSKRLKRYDGCLINKIENDSVVKKTGIRENDIIIKINDIDTLCMSRMLELLVQCDPLKPIKITVDRFGTIKNFTIQPKVPNMINISKDKDKLIIKGVVFKELNDKVKQYLSNAKIYGGVQIVEVSDDAWRKVVKKGYIVLSINDQEVRNIEDVKNILTRKRGTFLFDGVYPGNIKTKECFAIRLGEKSTN